MPDCQALVENKRECFDGMRAYHQSEISHTNHAITMLLSMAAAIGAVVLAILFPEKPPMHVREIAWGLFSVVSILGFTIACTTHMKINGDHNVYAAFGREYVRTSGLLGFYDEVVDVEGCEKKKAIKESTEIGQGRGYRKTQVIIWCFAGVLSALSLIFALAVPCIAP